MTKKKFVCLSHWINEKTPSYGNKGGFVRKSLSSIKSGSSANSEQWTLNNHIGTHIDFPFHFDDNGKVSSDFEDPFIIFENVMVLEMKHRVKPNHIIDVQDLKALIKDTDLDAEILLLKTHFEELRKNDIYWENNPGYDYQIADFLRKRFPSIKAFGIDTISLTSVKNREMGKKAHQAFLVSKPPILIIEDMKLGEISSNTNSGKMILTQFPIEKTDGTPVNCILNIK